MNRFNAAVSRWLCLSASHDEDDSPALERAEKTILRHSPQTASEAIAMLDVVAAGISAGERSDRLDIMALHAVSALLRSHA